MHAGLGFSGSLSLVCCSVSSLSLGCSRGQGLKLWTQPSGAAPGGPCWPAVSAALRSLLLPSGEKERGEEMPRREAAPRYTCSQFPPFSRESPHCATRLAVSPPSSQLD